MKNILIFLLKSRVHPIPKQLGLIRSAGNSNTLRLEPQVRWGWIKSNFSSIQNPSKENSDKPKSEYGRNPKCPKSQRYQNSNFPKFRHGLNLDVARDETRVTVIQQNQSSWKKVNHFFVISLFVIQTFCIDNLFDYGNNIFPAVYNSCTR